MAKTRYVMIACYCLMIMLLTGCWDSVPIEERGFVVGSALDKTDAGENGNNKLTLTNQFVIPTGIGTNDGGAASQQSAFVNLTASGDSIYAMDKEMASLTSKVPFFEHLQLLVISEDLLRTPKLFANSFDIFVRDKQMRRGVSVIASEKAKDILDIQPKNEKLPAVYIDNLLEESLKKASLFKPVFVGDIHDALLSKRSFTIPMITPLKDKVKYDGAVVYQGFEEKVVGSLNQDEMFVLNMVTSEDMHGGTIEYKVGENIYTYQLSNVKDRVKIDTKDPKNLTVHVDVSVEGGIAEIFGDIRLDNTGNIELIEQAAAKRIEELVYDAIGKAQKEFNADIFLFGDKLRKHHYTLWEKVKDDWEQGENYFAKSDVQVTAKAKIRTVGATEISK